MEWVNISEAIGSQKRQLTERRAAAGGRGHAGHRVVEVDEHEDEHDQDAHPPGHHLHPAAHVRINKAGIDESAGEK